MEPKAEEIMVTPAMIGAGVEVLWRSQANASSYELVEMIYRAMVGAKAA